MTLTMFISRSHSCQLAFVLLCSPVGAIAQDDPLLAEDQAAYAGDSLLGPDETEDPYAPLNASLGGDSVRRCNGVACSGWVEDHYPDGTLKHRGYYGEGRLITYRNYHPNGQVERDFKLKDQTRCSMRTFFDNGTLRSETHFVDGASRTYSEYYLNGQVRYVEEKHPSLPYYMIMDLFAPDGKPISTLRVADKKHGIFEQHEYWPNGQPRASGRSQFNPDRFDSQRIGAWTYYDMAGKPMKEERYLDGKVHETAELR